MDLIFVDHGAYYRKMLLTQKSYLMSCVRPLASSLSSSKAMLLLLTQRIRQSTF